MGIFRSGRHFGLVGVVTVGGAALALASASCGDPELVSAPPTNTGGGSTGGSGNSESSGGEGNLFEPIGGAGGSEGGAGGEGGIDTTGCGDGVIQPIEQCDDNNSLPGDGCSGDCQQVEQDFGCPVPGEPCVSTVVCGDGLISGLETCDDGDALGDDGCSSTCQLELGWICPQANLPCVAAMCGDGIIAGNEECEDDNVVPTSDDGCSDTCKRELGYECGAPLTACYLTTCNDGIKEGDEPCDDGNQIIGDGCNPFCEVEPDCSTGPCKSECGDGLILPADNEECDDGNTVGGDGCSVLCTVEPGFDCSTVVGDLPAVLEVPIVYRDFVGIPTNGSTRHVDFQAYSGSGPTPGLVAATLGMDGKPVYTGICQASLLGPCPYGQQTTNQTAFDQWYRDTAGVNITHIEKLALNQTGPGIYYFPDSTFFPLDGLGWPAQVPKQENLSSAHNFAFTSEIRTWFEFKGGEQLSFSGDDDVWVFINGQLALDLGGLHSQASGSFVLNPATAQLLGLTVDNVYEIALFHAERHTNQSNFNLTLGGFVKAKSECSTECGDGVVAGDETCDDGVNDGSYGSCNPDCTPAPFCGDATLQDPPEQCDSGFNLAVYSTNGQPGCAPGCVLGAYCGDGNINSLFGEQCDDGTNAGGYGGCMSNCTFGPRCGDGVKQTSFGEQCDDGNKVSGDGCSAQCKLEGPA